MQTIPQYKNKTALFITTDHGRGDAIKAQWRDHGSNISGASEIWFAVMMPGIKSIGEMKTPGQYYANQFAQTIASMLGVTYAPLHPTGKKISF